jgi:hypothetical protein
VAVHDGWSPYWRYEQVTHALCGAHPLRELDAITDEPRQGWAAGMAELLIDAKLVADQARAAGRGRCGTKTRCATTSVTTWSTTLARKGQRWLSTRREI